MNILHLDTSILGEHSVSRTLSAAVTARLTEQHPQAVVTYRDLSAAPVPHLSGAYLSALRDPQDAGAALQEDLALGATVLQEFLAADVVVIGVAFYNFTIPTQLKAWIDRILVAGKTFTYGADGRPVGLAEGKRVILAIARGGFYGEGAPTEAFEHAETYLRSAFGFIGIRDLEVVVAEGLAAGPDMRQAGIANAERQIASLAA